MKAADYQRLLKKSQVLVRPKDLSQKTPIYLQQDETPAHQVKPSVHFIENPVAPLMNCPGFSPHLSISENTWMIMKL
jgi:hypothetical protein